MDAARWSIGVIGLIMDGIRPARVADQIIDDLRKHAIGEARAAAKTAARIAALAR